MARFLLCPVPLSRRTSQQHRQIWVEVSSRDEGTSTKCVGLGLLPWMGLSLHFPAQKKLFIPTTNLPSQLEGKVHFFPSPQGSW